MYLQGFRAVSRERVFREPLDHQVGDHCRHSVVFVNTERGRERLELDVAKIHGASIFNPSLLSVCMCLSASVCLYLALSLCLSVTLSLSISVCLSLCVSSVSLSLSVSVFHCVSLLSPSLCLSLSLIVCLFCLPLSVSHCVSLLSPSVFVSICPSFSPHPSFLFSFFPPSVQSLSLSLLPPSLPAPPPHAPPPPPNPPARCIAHHNGSIAPTASFIQQRV